MESETVRKSMEILFVTTVPAVPDTVYGDHEALSSLFRNVVVCAALKF